MKSCYMIPDVRAIADVCDYYGIGRIITRINVPLEHRHKGYAHELLQQILDDADKEHINLYLEISPSDGLTYQELEAWYMRHGFHYWKGIYRRRAAARQGERL